MSHRPPHELWPLRRAAGGQGFAPGPAIGRIGAEETAMSVKLTPEQLQTLNARPEVPLHILDEQTGKRYVLMSREEYDKLVPYDDSESDPSEWYPLLWEVMKDDWLDPSMDVY